MATSKIEVFKTNLTPQRNALVDNIDAYLNTCFKSYENAEFQYQKIEMEKTFNLNIPQDIYQPATIGNYVRLEEIGKTYYFFILDYEWTSVSSVSINCVMDTVNTFEGELYWSDKSNVLREHRDRFEKVYDQEIITNWDQIGYIGISENTYVFNYRDPRLINAELKDLVIETKVQSGDADVSVMEQNLDPATGNVTAMLNIINNIPGNSTINIRANIRYDALKRVIDFIPEGLNPVLYGNNGDNIYDKGNQDSWYVIYNTEYPGGTPTEQDTGYISTLLCKDGGFNAKVSSDKVTQVALQPSDLEEGLYYVIDINDVDNKWRVVTGYDTNNHEIIKTEEYTVGEAEQATYWLKDIGFYRQGDLIYVESLDMERQKVGLGKKQVKVSAITSLSKFTLKSEKDFVIYKYPSRIYNQYSDTLRDDIRLSPTLPIDSTYETVYISGYSEVDTTQSTLVKIIKFPYCPISYKVEGDTFVFDALVGKDVNEKLKATLLTIPKDVKFGHELETNIKNPFLVVEEALNKIPSASDMRDKSNESKLYNSEFYSPRVVYDSFVKGFDLEKLTKQQDSVSPTLKIDYKPSRVFNSSFMFTFPEYDTDGKNTDNYNNILICNRNNEMPIFSSQYLNYVRNGYNYDVKAKNLAFTQSVASLGIQAALAGVGLSMNPIAKPDPIDYGLTDNWREHRPGSRNSGRSIRKFTKDLSIYEQKQRASIITGGIGAVAGIANIVVKSIQAEQALQQKVDTARASSISVSSCDDIDLLEEYSGNKAKVTTFKTSDKVTGDLADLFHYTGYRTDNQKVPNFSNRYWFNFVQAEPVFEEDVNVYEEYLDDIKARYAQGVTIYHTHNGEWDWEQIHENWENWLVKEN